MSLCINWNTFINNFHWYQLNGATHHKKQNKKRFLQPMCSLYMTLNPVTVSIWPNI